MVRYWRTKVKNRGNFVVLLAKLALWTSAFAIPFELHTWLFPSDFLEILAVFLLRQGASPRLAPGKPATSALPLT
jgi:hypothetical protein